MGLTNRRSCCRDHRRPTRARCIRRFDVRTRSGLYIVRKALGGHEIATSSTMRSIRRRSDRLTTDARPRLGGVAVVGNGRVRDAGDAACRAPHGAAPHLRAWYALFTGWNRRGGRSRCAVLTEVDAIPNVGTGVGVAADTRTGPARPDRRRPCHTSRLSPSGASRKGKLFGARGPCSPLEQSAAVREKLLLA